MQCSSQAVLFFEIDPLFQLNKVLQKHVFFISRNLFDDIHETFHFETEQFTAPFIERNLILNRNI